MKLKHLFFSLLLISGILFNKTYAQPELWGMTSEGGKYNIGTIFKTDINGENHSLQYSWFRYGGASPFHSELCKASNGKFYGMTYSGGTNNYGVLFEYDPDTDVYTKKMDFDSIKGSNPYGSLMQASNNKLYGMTYMGGANDYGVLFEYDPDNDTYTKKLDFNKINGSRPYSNLIETGTTGFEDISFNSKIDIYPNPATEILNIVYDKKFVMELYDITGRQVLKSETKETNISELESGTYIILIKDKQGAVLKTDKLTILL
jgi:uncharacterized repeat protein (TIGR03803 family)